MIFKNSAFVLLIWRGYYIVQLKQEKGILKYHPCGGKGEFGEGPLATVNRERREEVSFYPDFIITQDDYLCDNIFEMPDIDTVWKQKFYYKVISDEQMATMTFGDVKSWALISRDVAKSLTIENSSFAMLGLFSGYFKSESKQDVLTTKI